MKNTTQKKKTEEIYIVIDGKKGLNNSTFRTLTDIIDLISLILL